MLEVDFSHSSILSNAKLSGFKCQWTVHPVYYDCKDNTGLSSEQFYPILALILLLGSNCHADVAAIKV